MKTQSEQKSVQSIAKQVRWIWILLATLLVVVIPFILFKNISENKKVVFVDVVVLISKYRGMDVARRELEARTSTWQANLDTLKAEFDLTLKKYEEEKGRASAKELKLMEELLQSKQQQYLNYEQSSREQFQKQDQEMSSKLMSTINTYLKKYGEEKGYSVILAATQYGNIAYGDPALDITEEVLVGLNAEYDGGKK